jgi:predicted transcriptional regulator with HTH domain
MRLSAEKKEKISEQIIAFLYSMAPKAAYTSNIAKEIARDEEFIRVLLEDLKKKGLVAEIKKNSMGETYSRRIRWKISDKAYVIYNQKQ